MTIIELNGNPISFGDVGQGPVILLLAGWNEDHRMFRRIVPALARRYRVLTMDWRGHGEDRRHGGDFTIDDMAGDIVSFLDTIDVETVSTVSCAHGGWPTIEAAQRLGIARVPRIVLISWRFFAPGQTLLDWCARWQDPSGWQAGRESFFEYAIGTGDSAEVVNHVRNEMATFGAEYWHRTGREIGGSYRRWGTVAARLEALDEPRSVAHIYTLPHDSDYVGASRDFAVSHPWFVPYRLPGETHFPVLESPAAVSRIIHEFLSDAEL
jgi:pimeloyl-ACP methyl ester carboxylesterase